MVLTAFPAGTMFPICIPPHKYALMTSETGAKRLVYVHKVDMILIATVSGVVDEFVEGYRKEFIKNLSNITVKELLAYNPKIRGKIPELKLFKKHLEQLQMLGYDLEDLVTIDLSGEVEELKSVHCQIPDGDFKEPLKTVLELAREGKIEENTVSMELKAIQLMEKQRLKKRYKSCDICYPIMKQAVEKLEYGTDTVVTESVYYSSKTEWFCCQMCYESLTKLAQEDNLSIEFEIQILLNNFEKIENLIERQVEQLTTLSENCSV